MNDATAPETANRESEAGLVGRLIGDRYRVEELLGTGGMGSVYRAQHVLLKKPVAFKVLRPEMQHFDEAVARFEREAVVAARIENPHVVSATDFGTLEEGEYYLVLEYVDGESLTSLIAEGPLPQQRAILIARQIAEALGAAHDAGIVHRDLKPDNVLLVDKDGTADFVKVLDFGIAKLMTDEGAREGEGPALVTKIGSVFGTPTYMAPEQALGEAVDHRADLYALGIILHEMLTGAVPFKGEEIGQTLAKQLTEPPPPLPEGTHPELSSLVGRLLEKTRDARVQDAHAVVEQLDRIAAWIESPESYAATAPALDVTPASLPGVVSRARPHVPVRWILLAGGAAFVAFTLVVAVLVARRRAERPLPTALARGMPRVLAISSNVTVEPAVQPAVKPAPSGSAKPAGGKKASSAKTTKSRKPAPKARKRPRRRPKSTQRKRRRRTGPGGIYIPPPSEWF